MIILLHVLIALSSIVFATYLLFAPSVAKLRVSYGLIAATLVTGTYLIAATQTHILQTCVTGLVYIGIVSVATVSAHAKLARQHASKSIG